MVLFPSLVGGFDPVPPDFADLRAYAGSRRRPLRHLPLRRHYDWRWIEGGWETDYGSERQIAQHLHMACREANSGFMTDDWDDPTVYQRRRRWYC